MNTQESRDAFFAEYNRDPECDLDRVEEEALYHYTNGWNASRAGLKGPVDVESPEEFAASLCYGSKFGPLDLQLVTDAIYKRDAALSSYSVQRDVEEGRLLLALRSCRALAIRNRNKGEWAEISRFCLEAGLKPTILRTQEGAALLPTELREDKSDV